MARPVWMLIALALLVALPGAPLLAAQSHALLIANHDYEHWDDLETPFSDVQALGQVLEQKYGFRTRILRNATRSDMIDEIEALKGQLGEDDSLMIYFAGHGILRADGGYWVGVDAKLNSRGGWLKYSAIDDLIDHRNGLKARHVLIVADSCYSGSALRARNPTDIDPAADRLAWLARVHAKRSRTVLTSGGTEPVVDRVGEASHSIFAGELIDRLGSNSDILDANSLFSTIKVEVHARARRAVGDAAQVPEYGPLSGVGHDGGAFIFVPRGQSIPTPDSGPGPIDENLVLRGQTRVVYESAEVRHLGDERIGSWERKEHQGQCHDIAFSYDQRAESVTVEYDAFGIENAVLEVDGRAYAITPQAIRPGDKRPNYWEPGRTVTIPLANGLSSAPRVRFCSRPVSNPEFAGDLDDLQIRNIRVRVN